MVEPRDVPLDDDALSALLQLLGIMTDQVLAAEDRPRWELEPLLLLETRLEMARSEGAPTVMLGIDEVALVLDGMAFTEAASAHLPWAEMVRWTSDFVTAELRTHWDETSWRAFLTSSG